MPNYDEQNGIFYGVISQHSISPEALDDIYYGPHSKDLYYEAWKEELSNHLKENLINYARKDEIEQIIEFAIDTIEYDSNGEMSPEYDDGEYHILKCLDSDLMIVKSPYVTWAPPCSPCVPAAGNLDDAVRERDFNPDNIYAPGADAKLLNSNISPFYGDSRERLTYCFGPEFFDDDQAPYPYARLNDDGTIGEWVFPETKEEKGE